MKTCFISLQSLAALGLILILVSTLEVSNEVIYDIHNEHTNLKDVLQQKHHTIL